MRRSRTSLPAELSRGVDVRGRPGLLDLAYAAFAAPPGIHEAYVAALEALPEHLPRTGYEPVGLPVLRAAVAARYTQRGLPTDPDQVLVTTGALSAWALLLRQVLSPGDRVLVEHPTYPHALAAVAATGGRAVPWSLDPGEGWDLPGLDAVLRRHRPRLAYVVPDGQNPTGAVMREPDRRRVVEQCRRAGTRVVVDETHVDLWLDEPLPAPTASFGADVLTLGSMSKGFWGGLRVGWLRGSRADVAELALARGAQDLGTPLVEQLAAAHLLNRSDEVLVPRRAQLRAHRSVLLASFAEHLPQLHAPVPAAGLSVWAHLPGGCSTALAAAAPRHGVRLAAGPRFGVDGSFEDRLRLPFTLPPQDLRRAVLGVAAALGDLRPSAVGTPAFLA